MSVEKYLDGKINESISYTQKLRDMKEEAKVIDEVLKEKLDDILDDTIDQIDMVRKKLDGLTKYNAQTGIYFTYSHKDIETFNDSREEISNIKRRAVIDIYDISREIKNSTSSNTLRDIIDYIAYDSAKVINMC